MANSVAGEKHLQMEGKNDIKKSIRPKMPMFDGENVHGWIHKAKKYLNTIVFQMIKELQ